MREFWFWQTILSPHIGGLAAALASRGGKVSYVAGQAMPPDRAKQGWVIPQFCGVNCMVAECAKAVEALVQEAPADAIHICQGIRGNGLMAHAQRAIFTRGLRQWVVMETVDDRGWAGVLKRLEYARLFRARRERLEGILATGHHTTPWVVARGMPADRVYPFAYFLPEANISIERSRNESGRFRFLFVGQFIPRKRVDWLIEALAMLPDRDFEVWLVGCGKDEAVLRALASARLGPRVRWLGSRPMAEIPLVMSQADCLVLPSVHDGWGAVVSEALMVGTPVICSDACGAAGVVRTSGCGAVFRTNDVEDLRHKLLAQFNMEPVIFEDRIKLSKWAQCLGAGMGAEYLEHILEFSRFGGQRPVPPWQCDR